MGKLLKVHQFMFQNQKYNKISSGDFSLKIYPFSKKRSQKGITIIEILVVVAIIGIALIALFSVTVFSLKVSLLVKETAEANSLAQEAIEAVRNFRDGTTWNTDGLGTLTVETNYYPEKTSDNPPRWNLVSGQETIGEFTRKIVFKKVFRDANDNVSESGTEDPDTREIIVTVSWKDKNVRLVTFLTNWQ